MQELEKLLQSEQYEAVIELTKKLSPSLSTDSNILTIRAYAKSKLNRFEEALADYEKAIELNPGNASAISERAVVKFKLGKKTAALLDLDLAQQIEPNNPYRYSSRAYIKDSLGDVEGAIADYQKAIELDPEDAIAYNNLGMLEEKLGYIEKSKQRFKKADELAGIQQPFTIPLNEKENNIEDATRKKQPGIFNTIKEIVSNKSERQKFLQFISNGFKIK
jgi:Flp pilus assembly protein TadD